MPGILVATGFVRIDADTSPAMKALKSLGAIGGNALATAIGPASAAAATAIGAVGAAASVAGAAVTAYGVAVGQQFSQVKEAMTKQQAAEDAATKSTDARTLAQQLAREGGFKYGRQVKITADMTDAARLRAENYNKALSASESASMAAKQSQQAYKAELGQMPKPTAQLTEALQKLKTDTKSWSDSMASSTMPVFTRGVQFLDRLLPKLSPIVRGVAREVDAFADTLGEGAAGKVFREFGQNVNENGAGALRTFLDVTRNIIVGIGGVLNAFLPMSAGVTGGLEEMTEKFANWGATLGESEGFGRFTEIAQEAGPKLVELFRSLGSAFVDVASAAGPMSGVGLTLVTILAQLVDAIPTPVLQLLVPVILAVNLGMKLYALYTSIATAATWLFSTANGASNVQIAYQNTLLALLWVRMKIIATWQRIVAAATLLWQLAMTAQGRALAWQIIMLGVHRVAMVASAVASGIATAATWALNAAIAVLTSPITLVIAAIALLVAAIVLLWKKNEGFRNAVKAIWGAIKDAAGAVGRWFAGPFLDFFKAAWNFIYKWMVQPWVTFFGTTLPNAARTLKDKALEFLGNVRDGLRVIWDFIYKWVIQPWVTFFGTTLPGAARTLKNKVLEFVGAMRDGLRVIWDWIYKNVIKPNIVTWTQTVPDAAKTLKNKVTGFFGGLRDGVSGIWSSIKRNTLGNMQSFFTKSVPGWANTMKGKVTGFFGEMRDGVGRTWDGIKSKTKTPINWVLDRVWNQGIRNIWGRIAGWIGIKNTLGKVRLLASGGTVGTTPMGLFNKPTAIVGEGNPMYPEFVIPTDPKYRGRAQQLWEAAGGHFMESGGILGSLGDWLGSAVSTVNEVIKGAADFFSDPVGKAKKLLNGTMKGMEAVGTSPWALMVRQLPRKAIDGLIEAVKDNVGSLLGAVGLGSGGKGVERWRTTVLTALRMVGQVPALANITLKRMNQESGGNPRAVNLWDVNAKNGTPSVGLMQVIRPTFRAHAGKLRGTGPFMYGVSINPLANIYASMRYALSRYGSLSSAYGRAGGYATGTDGATAGWHWVGEYGPELMKMPAGARLRSYRQSVRQAAVAPSVIHLAVENHGVIGSQREVEDWLVGTLERLRSQRRLPRALGGAA